MTLLFLEGVIMTKSEAKYWLAQYLRDNFNPNASNKMPDFPGQITPMTRNAYIVSFVEQIIEAIDNSIEKDPISVVDDEWFYAKNDYWNIPKEQTIAFSYASFRELYIGEMYAYLRAHERRNEFGLLEDYRKWL